ncbi:Flagellar motor switch FliN/Type III secretion HrcQb [Acididesulfobacillus acetoxydans]|uniref:Flagellar motor switch FliN/Type III secretion HrcQb n=1 Tax=Acididesulfobacillus acetoxydans TaxID=1561005 RepID=A0A8S0X717_9FIRM|nr:flagellar motor switch phosphatase FliY [Acididesulfobacillus acetoxydans]CAA7602960.1 Flagellar motor switch FliN/Type III secretion HrcQb [Acididesulfobacillus acetoxydans]CEJ05842.1 Flagellar motor switch phosphatase FliY [Acididesulfobacillus acetoxydans]
MSDGMLSQEEIDALLKGSVEVAAENSQEEEMAGFSEQEKDAIGEIANISMGTAATTLSLLLGRKVEITTPRVDVTSAEQVRRDYPVPSVIVNVKYKAGLEGSNLLILSQKDGAVIVDLMMGGDGTNSSPELSEMQISGIAEAMNQMMGSAATSMSTMFKSPVDITPPQLALHDLGEEKEFLQEFLQASEPFVRISFQMVVESAIDSILVQVIPISVAKGMVEKLMATLGETVAAATEGEDRVTLGSSAQGTPAARSGAAAMAGGGSSGFAGAGSKGAPGQSATGSAPAAQGIRGYGGPAGQSIQGYGSAGMAAPGSGGPATVHGAAAQPPLAAVRTARFTPLEPGQETVPPNNLDLIMDVPLQVSVELGKAKKTIKEILEMGPGSVVELDRLAGEPVDMIVNGKLIAKCEVVVINETFGIRITDIVHPAQRIQTLD